MVAEEATVEVADLVEVVAEDLDEVLVIEEMAIGQVRDASLITEVVEDLEERNEETRALEEILTINQRTKSRVAHAVQDSIPQKDLLTDAAGNLF